MPPSNSNKKNRRWLFGIAIAVVAMFSVTFLAMIPMYNVMARMTGVNGKLYQPSDLQDCQLIDDYRKIEVQVSTSLHANLPFLFKPLVSNLRLNPGAVQDLEFIVKNNSDVPMEVHCLASVAPGQTAMFIRQVKSFCDSQYYFNVGQERKLHFQFYIDTMLPQDVLKLTLNFTLTNADRHLKQRPKYLNGKDTV